MPSILRAALFHFITERRLCPPQKFRLSFESSPLRTDRSPMEGLGLPIIYILWVANSASSDLVDPVGSDLLLPNPS
jgi:hypothetical protein